jgi:acyl-CoA synthetase (AMP-forming)/AMP-acid ligase II
MNFTNSYHSSRKSRSVSWLPMYHDMGLMSHLFTPLLTNADIQYLISPLAFLKDPLLWILLISKYRY